MAKTCAVTAAAAVAVLSLACRQPTPPDAATLVADARAALGGPTVRTLEFTGSGWEGSFGQPWNIAEGWGRWRLSDYRRVIDYDTTTSRQTAVRQAGMDPDRLGGGGAQPNAPPQNQQSVVGVDAGFEPRLQIWLTPHGFLELAATAAPSVASETRDGVRYDVLSFPVADGDVSHEMRGYLDAESHRLEKVQTWIDSPVYGDMLVEAEFGDYQEFDGLRFPSSLVQKRGGFTTLDLRVEHAAAGVAVDGDPPAAAGGRGGRGGGGGRGGRGGAAVADAGPFTRIGDGVFVINGAYQSVAVEFDEFAVVIEGLQSPARAAEIIDATKMAIPGKPIRYVVTTHAHFDHISGLREFVAEGATIVAHEMDVPFYEMALGAPRTLNPDRASALGATPAVQGVGDRDVIEDGTRRIELYRLQGSLHADDMMIAYLPDIRTIVEADLVQPWMNPAFAGGAGGDGPHPFLVHLAAELDRLALDYEQFVPVHRPTPAPTVSKKDFLAAAGRAN